MLCRNGHGTGSPIRYAFFPCFGEVHVSLRRKRTVGAVVVAMFFLFSSGVKAPDLIFAVLATAEAVPRYKLLKRCGRASGARDFYSIYPPLTR